MPRPTPLAERAMEVTAAIVGLRAVVVPLYEAAIASGRWDAIAEAKAVADDLNRAQRASKRVAGLAEAIACPDGLFGASHGRAA